ncbi:MAG: hypothetical protein KatS3mg105_3510 [Gemmatales bacterium]|nr:MAG: hypothetical protein KatS3mg105_3510 [Gemmatales bacterium]
MKCKRNMVALLFVGVFSACAAGASPAPSEKAERPNTRHGYGTQWYTSVGDALVEAQKQGKPVFVFHTLGDLFDKL